MAEAAEARERCRSWPRRTRDRTGRRSGRLPGRSGPVSESEAPNGPCPEESSRPWCPDRCRTPEKQNTSYETSD